MESKSVADTSEETFENVHTIVLFWAFENLFLTPDTIKLSDVYEDFYERFVCWKGDMIEMMVCATQGEKTPSNKNQKKKSDYDVHGSFSENPAQKQEEKKRNI